MSSFPYTYISCPCIDTTAPSSLKSFSRQSKDSGKASPFAAQDNNGEDKTFDPKAPRSNYSLYSSDQLLYCSECSSIRCPRCLFEEIASWFCPNCLFETPSSLVKSEGNRLFSRCMRNCLQCPICESTLVVCGIEGESSTSSSAYSLNCTHCTWSSQEIGIQFEKPNSITPQLLKMRKAHTRNRDMEQERRNRELKGGMEEAASEPPEIEALSLSHEEQFANLKQFYTSHLQELAANGMPSQGSDLINPEFPLLSSPSSFARLMHMYGVKPDLLKKNQRKITLAREAEGSKEGVKVLKNEDDIIEKMRRVGWDGASSIEQRREHGQSARFISDLQPFQALLRTKRSKRCRTCRSILIRPETKHSKYKFRSLARSVLPTITLHHLSPTPPPSTALPPSYPLQFILTFRNPLFDAMQITLATPSLTPGPLAHRVTILCPQFSIGANIDAWNEALATDREKRRTRAEALEGQAEAGKIWERGRAWTSVVVEIVPAAAAGRELCGEEDVLEVPVFVRLEYETEDQEGEKEEEKRDKVKKELAYWCVLGVGRVAREG
ncbi:MAG: hypothetical protein M1829_006395 [Trizodia sp. TS-e1964]|nr:MAG: hypothetical protein M1829_006395 [Trizodia sp. TS-e1964]